MEEVILMQGLDVPDAEGDDVDRKTVLSLACIAAVKPDCTDLEAAASVAKAFVAESPDVYLDPLVDEHALADVVNAGEAKQAAEYALSVKLAKARKKLVVHTRKSHLHKYFKPSKPPKYPEKQKQQPRWVPPKQESDTAAISQWINDYKGPTTTVLCDNDCGRWRAISAHLQCRSIAWTKRG